MKSIKVKKNGSLVAHYIEEINKKIIVMGGGDGNYAYRGHKNSRWELTSSAYRRLEDYLGMPPSLEIFMDYHQTDLLGPAKMDGHDFKNGQRLSDLELLAELQHFGAATCLIDFTRSFLVALWFACEHSEETVTKRHNKIEKTHHGKVFIMNTNNFRIFHTLTQEDLKSPISNFQSSKDSSKDIYLHWAPHGINNRILKQDSLFVFGKMKVSDHFQSIVVCESHKEELLVELDALGVNGASLFKDLPGFARNRGTAERISIRDISGNALFHAGGVSFGKNKIWKMLSEPNYLPNEDAIKRALKFYDDAIEKKGFLTFEAYLNRGRMHLVLNELAPALEDISEAIRLGRATAEPHMYRGITHFKMENYEEAVKDFIRSIEYSEDRRWIYDDIWKFAMNEWKNNSLAMENLERLAKKISRISNFRFSHENFLFDRAILIEAVSNPNEDIKEILRYYFEAQDSACESGTDELRKEISDYLNEHTEYQDWIMDQLPNDSY